jgi:hypothetical protein
MQSLTAKFGLLGRVVSPKGVIDKGKGSINDEWQDFAELSYRSVERVKEKEKPVSFSSEVMYVKACWCFDDETQLS